MSGFNTSTKIQSLYNDISINYYSTVSVEYSDLLLTVRKVRKFQLV